MFEFSKEKMEQKKAEDMARNMLSKMISEAVLTSETAPEEMKLSVLILGKASDIQESIHKLVDEHVSPGHRSNVETLKTVLEHLGMVEIGVKQFIESTPFVPDSDGKEEVSDGNN